MKITCPVCEAAFQPRQLGVVVPCPSCGNPVAVPETAPAAPKPKAEAPPPPAPKSTRAPGDIPWGLAGIVVLILAAGHYAFYLLITADARGRIDELVTKHGSAVRQETESPGPTAPSASSPKFKEWHEQRELYLGSRSYADHEAHRSLVAGGMLISLLVLLGITGFALFRIKARIQRETARRNRGR